MAFNGVIATSKWECRWEVAIYCLGVFIGRSARDDVKSKLLQFRIATSCECTVDHSRGEILQDKKEMFTEHFSE